MILFTLHTKKFFFYICPIKQQHHGHNNLYTFVLVNSRYVIHVCIIVSPVSAKSALTSVLSINDTTITVFDLMLKIHNVRCRKMFTTAEFIKHAINFELYKTISFYCCVISTLDFVR